jgi:undecaprenyl-diphosphatase
MIDGEKMNFQHFARLDLAFSLLCLQHKFSQPVARISRCISRTGDGHLYAFLLALGWWLGQSTQTGSHETQFSKTGLWAFALELPLYWLAKNSFKRRRPHELSQLIRLTFTPSDKYSLPSGHTAAAFVMATLIGQFYPSFYLLALCWACLIGLSRILLGVHFITDVLIGAMLGIACAKAAMMLTGVPF